jgi:hypothetical protein
MPVRANGVNTRPGGSSGWSGRLASPMSGIPRATSAIPRRADPGAATHAALPAPDAADRPRGGGNHAAARVERLDLQLAARGGRAGGP